MNVLVDTNVLGRLAEPGHPQCQIAFAALNSLDTKGDLLYIVTQVLYEFWVAATRPLSANGLGFSVQEAASELARVKMLFPVLPDDPAIYPLWERLVTTLQITGKNAHDARLVAAMSVHGVSHLLTFNVAHFRRYAGITILDPAAITPPVP